MELSARDIARITGGTVVAGDPDARARSWSNDSRLVGAGACFVALVDARDGHTFVDDAFRRGATIAIVSRDRSVTPPHGAAVVRVDDALGALAALGRAARATLAGA